MFDKNAKVVLLLNIYTVLVLSFSLQVTEIKIYTQNYVDQENMQRQGNLLNVKKVRYHIKYCCSVTIRVGVIFPYKFSSITSESRLCKDKMVAGGVLLMVKVYTNLSSQCKKYAK